MVGDFMRFNNNEDLWNYNKDKPLSEQLMVKSNWDKYYKLVVKGDEEPIGSVHGYFPVFENGILTIVENDYNLYSMNQCREKMDKFTERSNRYNNIHCDDNELYGFTVCGKTICVTGALHYGTRDVVHTALESLGANISKGVTKKTDLLIVGANAGSKLDKAKLLGIKIMSEEFLIKEIFENK